MDYVVELLDIRKEFPSVVACDNITFQLKRGEIHALLGENGAGKSTLTNILFGLYQPDSGSIRLRGREVSIPNPNVANHLGIGMVHQHFKLVHNFTVTENIILGSETTNGLFIDLRSAAARITELSNKYGLNVNPHAKISDVSVGMQQRVEILKMLYRNAEILIFDEPTAVLTPQEIQELMKIMKNLIAEGKSIILITHKLKEIKAVADRCTVIRRGKLIGTVDVASTSQETLAEMMVGRKITFTIDKQEQVCGGSTLVLEGLSVRNNNGVLGVKNLSLEVHAGEIVGLAGIDGNGQVELVESIIGLRKVESGKIFLKGHDITTLPIRDRLNSGVSHIPEDRHKHGLVLEYTVGENLILKIYNQEPFSRRGLLQREAIAEHSNRVIQEFDVRAGQGAATSARSMSGGNQQKTIVAREIDRNPDLLIAVQPTRGLDVGAIEYIHRRLLGQRNKGKAVLMVSLELDEIMNLSDRIAVINNGELIGVVDANDTTENEVGLMMAGIKRGAMA
ncbi:MAG: simple sugar transport system ATP-binding protein [Bacillota bacterium]|nr:MAG: simple sugar transport system ATP-binding protein [Bacillota bacterium]MBS3949489.1 ABC transporter ATP-binding protein [Peptococcaceae bacterium]